MVFTKKCRISYVAIDQFFCSVIVRNDKKLIDVTKKWLSSNFEMKDMGDASYVLGVKIFRNRSKRLLGLSQETYI